jgi:rubrerythrin
MTRSEVREKNMTGAAVAPERAEAMVAATEEFGPSGDGDARAIAAVRVMYANEDPTPRPDGAEADGSAVLLDKLGERLAFERAGVRLYEALVSKHEAYGSFEGGPSREDLEHLLGEEQAHFAMLGEAIAELGGDPTELTRSATVQLAASRGVADVLVDPRVSFVESLEAIAIAELADNECWQTLAELARLGGNEDLGEQCEEAFATEQEHLEKVRSWLAAAQGRPLGREAGEAEDEAESGDGKPRRAARATSARRKATASAKPRPARKRK